MTVFLVGAGPGDVGLITVRGQELLKSCDAVVYDRLANPELLKLVPENATRVAAGKGPGDVDLTQDQTNAKLVELDKDHDCIVRLKGGDPYVFGRGSEEALYLEAHNVAYEVVPGITSSIAGAAYAGIPITHRGVATNFTVVTGHEDPSKDAEQVKWAELAAIDGTIVVLMGVKNRAKIAEALIAGGKKPDTAVAIVRNATRNDQMTIRTTLAEIGSVDALNPSIIIIGSVAEMNLSWFENKPLFGKKVAVTRAREQASELTAQLIVKGAQVVEAPSISITPCDFVFPNLDDVTYVVFTSINGVRHTMDALFAAGLDVRYFADASIGAIGDATAQALKEYGLVADIVPSRFVAEELVELFGEADPELNKVVCFKATDTRDVLEKGLVSKGYEVINIDVYKTHIAQVPQETIAEVKDCDAITFASSSTVRNAIELFGFDVVESIPLKVSIGPITTATMRECGLEPDLEAEPYSIEGMVSALIKDQFS